MTGVHDQPDNPDWGVDEATLRRWSELTPGLDVQIVKRSARHGGEERARYPGTVIESDLPAPWVTLAARWSHGRYEEAGLAFEHGDLLHESFSPVHPYNVFAVHTPVGRLKGWYANVDWPAVLELEGDGLALVWNDLYIDVVGLPDGEVTVLDEDELAESGLARSDPELHARILIARDELVSRFCGRRPPFGPLDRVETDTDM